MMEFRWTQVEKRIARRAFDSAYQQECLQIRGRAEKMLGTASTPRDIWILHDFLTEQRTQTDEKCDYRYSVLIWVFARLIREGWMAEDQLAGLSEDKLQAIRAFIAFSARA